METPKSDVNEGLKDFVKKSLLESQKIRREYTLHNRIYVYIQDFLPENVDIVEVLQAIEDRLPPHITKEVDTIFIGTDAEIGPQGRQAGFTAMYDSGAIYVSNEQNSVEDMVDDIIHEFAHSLEQPYGFAIYLSLIHI